MNTLRIEDAPTHTDIDWTPFPGGELEGARPRAQCPACRARTGRDAAAGSTSKPALCFQCYRADIDRNRKLEGGGRTGHGVRRPVPVHAAVRAGQHVEAGSPEGRARRGTDEGQGRSRQLHRETAPRTNRRAPRPCAPAARAEAARVGCCGPVAGRSGWPPTWRFASPRYSGPSRGSRSSSRSNAHAILSRCGFRYCRSRRPPPWHWCACRVARRPPGYGAPAGGARDGADRRGWHRNVSGRRPSRHSARRSARSAPRR